MISVYVAASSKEIERAEAVMAALRKLGVSISHDWTAAMRANGPDASLPDTILLAELLADLERGVFGAAFVLALAGEGSEGRGVEIGAAWTHQIHIVVAGDASRNAWLRALGNEFFVRDADAVAHVAQLVREAA